MWFANIHAIKTVQEKNLTLDVSFRMIWWVKVWFADRLYHEGNRHCSMYLMKLLMITWLFSFGKLKDFSAINFHYIISLWLFNHLHITGIDPILHSVLIFICLWNVFNHIFFQVLYGFSWGRKELLPFFFVTTCLASIRPIKYKVTWKSFYIQFLGDPV